MGVTLVMLGTWLIGLVAIIFACALLIFLIWLLCTEDGMRFIGGVIICCVIIAAPVVAVLGVYKVGHKVISVYNDFKH